MIHSPPFLKRQGSILSVVVKLAKTPLPAPRTPRRQEVGYDASLVGPGSECCKLSPPATAHTCVVVTNVIFCRAAGPYFLWNAYREYPGWDKENITLLSPPQWNKRCLCDPPGIDPGEEQ